MAAVEQLRDSRIPNQSHYVVQYIMMIIIIDALFITILKLLYPETCINHIEMFFVCVCVFLIKTFFSVAQDVDFFFNHLIDV